PQAGPMNEEFTSAGSTEYTSASASPTASVSLWVIWSVWTLMSLSPTTTTLVLAPATIDCTASVASAWSVDDGEVTVNCDPPVNSIENCTGRKNGTSTDPATRRIAMMNHRRRLATNGNEVFPVYRL